MKNYQVQIGDKVVFEKDVASAYKAFREVIQLWRNVDPSLNVALGGDSHSGEWSVVFEDGFWLVFVGERGERHQMSFFTSVWDALSYAGFRATSGRADNNLVFPVLTPSLPLS
jgi:hypothetical protein